MKERFADDLREGQLAPLNEYIFQSNDLTSMQRKTLGANLVPSIGDC